MPIPIPRAVITAGMGQAILMAASPVSPAAFPTNSPSTTLYMPDMVKAIMVGRACFKIRLNMGVLVPFFSVLSDTTRIINNEF